MEEAIEHYSGFQNQESKLPFINMISLSSCKETGLYENKKFRLFIEQKFIDNSSPGDFTCYGLSSREDNQQATIP